ncbi:MAG: carbamoyltransferase HypF [Pseudomonadota bacterium]|nr:carbamoyltransferase HypF [Pseudomonadota bacterium]
MTCAGQDREELAALVKVHGLVQGVGFRPNVWRLARQHRLRGWVGNDGDGVSMHVCGRADDLEAFVDALRDDAPPLARIDRIVREPAAALPADADFRITISRSNRVHTGVVPDAATCAACIAETLDPSARRFRYPFTNCTHCGPRLSIIRRIPYDRATTSMASFPLCNACSTEYENPADRRFHAQPNACPECGPRLWLEPLVDIADTGYNDAGGDPIDAARRLLQAGRIVAIKGLGGIHLACDATDADAVARLRTRKHRDHKPFALMARDIDMIRRYCGVDETQTQLLRGTAAPIVLLDADGPERLADRVAPNLRCYGFMLPYTPLHHVLMQDLDAPIVLTSGNRSDEPQCTDNDEARERLAGIADALLLHDRDIVSRLDDSVVRITAGTPALLRRARGFAPAPLRLPRGFADAPEVLAFGGELKNTLCLLRDGQAILSQHLGDLKHPAANRAFHETLALYLDLFEHRPSVVAVDSHPDYLPSKTGRAWAAANDCRLIEVQHHHAHIAACMADNGLDLDVAPVLGIALDGTGFGDDGTIWGGEFLLADYRGYRRLAAFAAVPMPGGAQAIRQPWRLAYAQLRRAFGWEAVAREHAALPFFRAMADKPLATLDGMITSGLNSPLTSSCGRLFDAVAAVVHWRDCVSYEGQAAIELESAVDRTALDDGKAYPFSITDEDGIPRLEPGPMWEELLRDLAAGVAAGVVAARFHAGLAQGLTAMAQHLASTHGDRCCGRVALSGGVLQNRVLAEATIGGLEAAGFAVLRHHRVPANDGGLSLGQAAIAAARCALPTTIEDHEPCA